MKEQRPQMQRSHRNASIWYSHSWFGVWMNHGWLVYFQPWDRRFSALGVSLAVFLADSSCVASTPFIFLLHRYLLHASCLSPTYWVTSPFHGTATLGPRFLFLSVANWRSKAARQGGRQIWGFVDQSNYWPFSYPVFFLCQPLLLDSDSMGS
jgi:hypothetical protein